MINNFFYENKNINSILISSKHNLNLNNFYDSKHEKNLFPILSDYNKKDHSFLVEFFYLKNSSFIKFFINNMIDVPVCFKKSTSLKTKNFELPLLKFTNFLMKKGKKEKIIKILFSSFRSFFKNFKMTNIKTSEENFSWYNLYFFTTNVFWYFRHQESNKASFLFDVNFFVNYGNYLIDNQKIINNSYFLKTYLYSLLSKTSPIFSYFIYSVDKNIRKYSRGKSGKYTFIWKYVAPFKRIKLAMRWIAKDIKFYQSQKINQRLKSIFTNLMLNPEQNFSWKSKIFSHNYVFKNFRKSLMITLKTTS